MQLNVRTEFSQLRQKMIALRVGVQKSIPELLLQEGRLAAISMSKSTVPYGTGIDAKTQGEVAVRVDIFKVYWTPGMVFKVIAANSGLYSEADAFIAACEGAAARGRGKKKGKSRQDSLAVATGILKRWGGPLRNVPLRNFDNGDAHRNARNSRGRVTQRTPSMIVLDPDKLKDYIAREQAQVGFGKSAWAEAAQRLGGTRGLRGKGDITANWILRHHAPSIVSTSRLSDPDHPSLTIGSNVRYAAQILQPGAKNEAVRIAKERLLKQIKSAARAEARRLKMAA